MAQLEQALQRERDFMARVLSTAGALVIVVDRQGHVVRFNQACERLTGYSFDEVKGQTFWDLFLLPEEREAVKDVFAGLLRGRFPNEHEKYWVAKNGARRLIQWSNTALTDSAGDVEYVIGVGVDITQRREAEAVLRESEERFRTIFEGSTNGILIADPKSRRFLMGNGAICKMLGYEPGEITGMRLADIHRQEDMPFVMEHFERLANGAEDTGEDIPVKRKDGSVFFADVTATPIIVSGKAYVVGSFRNITAHKRAEEALRRERSLLDSVMQTTDAMLVLLDPRFNFVWVNPAYAETCRMKPQEMAGRNHFALYPDAENEAIFRRVRDSGKGVFYKDKPFVFPDQPERGVTYWDWSLTPVKDAAGKVTGLVFSLRETTEFKRAGEALRESEQRLRLALEGGRMGRWEWDLPDGSMFCCERTRELLGWRMDSSATRERFFRRVHPDDREALQKLRTRSAAEPADFQMDFRVIHAHGEPCREILWLASRGRVIHDEQGRAVRVVAVLFDITPRKQMEEQLQRLNDHLEKEVAAQVEELRDTIDRLQDEVARRVLAEGKLRKNSRMLEAFFQHTITPLAFMDKYFNFVRVNEAYARADGKTPEFFIGKNHFALYPHEENQAIFQQVVRTKKPYYAYAKPFTYANNPERGVTYWNWQLTPQLNEFGGVQSLVLSLENVTEQQKAFREIEQRARQLQELTLELSQAEDRERRRLAEILHDDLQQQLAAAKFHLGILRARVEDNAPAQEVTGQLNGILKDVIEKSRSLSHELSPAVLYQSDLGETFEWLARQVQAKHGLSVQVEIRGQVNPKSEAIRAFLFKAGREILFNVVKHARTREAKLRLQQVREQLWLTITDRGHGFDPELLGRTSGFGLLSIRERVELLGGRMKIRSVRGKGSAFLIAVPDAAMAEPATWDATGPKLRVLLVDDHKVVREGLAVLLAEQSDIEVVGQAGNGREAVDLAHQLQPDVIIMDAAMPVMPGDEATRQIKLHLPAMRVIGLSMSVEAEMAERMRDAGAEVYLLKTAPSEELLAAIRGR